MIIITKMYIAVFLLFSTSYALDALREECLESYCHSLGIGVHVGKNINKYLSSNYNVSSMRTKLPRTSVSNRVIIRAYTMLSDARTYVLARGISETRFSPKCKLSSISQDNIKNDCQGSITLAAEWVKHQLNVSGSCDFLFTTERSRMLQAAFDGFDTGYFSYADLIKVYDDKDKIAGKEISLDIADGDVVKTVIYSRGPALIVSIKKSLQRGFKLNITSFSEEHVEINSSLYFGNATTPRYIQRGDNFLMVKNLRFSFRITPVLGSSVSISFPELSLGDDFIQLLPTNDSIRSTTSISRFNITSDEVLVVLDTFRNRSPRGKGFSMIYVACGGNSTERSADVSLPTPLFHGFDKKLRCSYVFSSPSNSRPVVTLTVDTGNQNLGSSSVEIYADRKFLSPFATRPLQNISESFIGNGTEIFVVLKYDSDSPLLRPVIFANFSSRQKDCPFRIQGNMGTFSSDTYKGKYPNNFHCSYIISGRKKSTIWLQFVEIDLAKNDCGDYIEIKDEGNMTRVCKSKPYNYSSISNKVEVVFGTDGKHTAKGFIARWKIVTEGGRNAASSFQMKVFSEMTVAFLAVISVTKSRN